MGITMDVSDMRFPSPLTVTELNQYIKDLIDVNPPLSDIYIKGEISNFKAHSSGHFYFTLKDADSALKSVMFRSSAQKMEFMPENGMKVIAHGRISALCGMVHTSFMQIPWNRMESVPYTLPLNN